MFFYIPRAAMTKSVIIFSDFDGTITNRPGGRLVFTPFFRSLQILNVEGIIPPYYKHGPMKPEDKIVAIFREKFGPYSLDFDYSKKVSEEGNDKENYIDILMSKETVESFHALLRNPNVSIRIITKNRIEYTKALFKYQGFSDSEIERLHIIDQILLSKGNEVEKVLHTVNPKADFVYVLDDDTSDYESMLQGVQNCLYTETQIKRANVPPGQFKWKDYLQEINTLTSWQDVIASANEPQLSASDVQTTPEQTLPGTTVDTNNDKTEVTTPQSSAPLMDRAPVEGNATQKQEVTTSVKEEPKKDEYRTSKIVGIFAAVGFALGMAFGVACVLSGGLAPFGVGILGILGFGALTGLGLSGISALFGYDVAKGTEPDAKLDPITVARASTIIGSNASAYVHYYSTQNQSLRRSEPTDVAHHEPVLKTDSDSAAHWRSSKHTHSDSASFWRSTKHTDSDSASLWRSSKPEDSVMGTEVKTSI